MAGCVYCDGALPAHGPEFYHPVIADYGPFEIVRCPACKSSNTLNPPDQQRLGAFYANYGAARPKHYLWAERSGALALQYADYARRILRSAPAGPFRWADVGAGKGEVANNILAARPESQGTSIDIAPRPPGLRQDVGHVELDLNEDQWASAEVAGGFDLVYSVAVWEHVLRPVAFLASCLRLLRPCGTLIVICPDGNSLVGRLMGKSWPYFEPGEHLFVPSTEGALAALAKAAPLAGLSPASLHASARPMPVAYSLRYVLVTVGLGSLAPVLPRNLALPLPTGILQIIVRRD